MKICQSCGMPLHKDSQGGGSEKDGSKSINYCSHCYIHGDFVQKDFTAKDMQVFVQNHLHKNMKMPKFLAWLFTHNISHLKRWRI